MVQLQNDINANLPAVNYDITPIYYVKNWDLSNANPFSPIDQNGIAGQGNGNPRADFDNHAIVKYNNTYYDPSYGSSKKASKIEWEDSSIDGYGCYVSDPITGTFYRWKERLDPKGTLENTINP